MPTKAPNRSRWYSARVQPFADASHKPGILTMTHSTNHLRTLGLNLLAVPLLLLSFLLPSIAWSQAQITSPSDNSVFPTGSLINFSAAYIDDNCSAFGYSWTFEGGNPSSSTIQNPTGIIFSTPGSRNITLNVDTGSQEFCSNTTDSITIVIESPAISLEKSTNGLDADSPPGPSIVAGDPITWVYVATNTGDVDLFNVTITDNQIGPVCSNPGSFPPGTFATCTISSVPAIEGQYSNIGTATAVSPAGATVTDQDPSHYFGFVPEPFITTTLNTADPSAAELSQNTGSCTININESFPATQALKAHTDVTVFLNAPGGTATEGIDYAALPRSVIVPAGSNTANVTITPLPDAEIEGDETVTLTMAASEGYAISSPNNCTVTIADDRPQVTISATEPNASEAGSVPGLFTVTLDRPAPSDGLAVNLGAPSGSATSGTDYTALPGSVTIPAGSNSATVTVTPLADDEVEDPETVTLALAAGRGYEIGTPSSATVTISDNPPPISVTLTASIANASEQGPANGIFLITASRTVPEGGLTINLSAPGGSAIEGTDYTSLPSSVIIPAGANSATVTVTPLADNAVEEPETVVLAVAPGNGYEVGSPNTATVTITDNPPLISVTLTATAPNASEQGPTNGAFTVTASRDAPEGGLIVNLDSPGGNATEGSDYQSLPSSVAIPAGTRSATVTVRPLADTELEDPETVILALVPGSGYEIGSPDTATVTITDNPPLISVTLTASDPDASEQGSDSGEFTVLASRSAPPGGLTVNLGAPSGSATAGTDYTALSSSVLIPAGASSAAIIVTPLPDSVAEGDETVILSLAPGSGYEIGSPNSATVTIVDDPPPIDQISLTVEGDFAEGQVVTITASRNTILRATDQPLSIDYRTVALTATAGEDFSEVNGSFQWGANETGTRSVEIEIFADSKAEENETFIFELVIPDGIDFDGESRLEITITNVPLSISTKEDLNDNQRDLGAALDQLCPSTTNPDLQKQCDQLARLPDSELPAALDQIMPDEVAAMQFSATTGVHFFIDLLQQRNTALRSGKRGLDLDGLTLTAGDQSLPVGKLASSFGQELSGGSAGTSVFNADFGRLGVFLSGRVVFGEQDDTERETGYDFDTLGLLAGVDYRISDQFVLGGALGYLNTDSDLNRDAGKIDTTGWSASVYGTYYLSDQWYLDGALQYGWNDYESRRNITFGTNNTFAKGNTDGNQFSVSLTAGGDFYRGAWLMSPYLGLDFINASIDEYSESGGDGLALTVTTEDADILTSRLGLRISRNYSLSWGILSPTAFAEWAHEFKDDSREITSHFVVDPSVPFTIRTDDPDRNYFNLGVGASATFTEGRSGFINYRGRFGDSDFESHTLEAGVRLEF